MTAEHRDTLLYVVHGILQAVLMAFLDILVWDWRFWVITVWTLATILIFRRSARSVLIEALNK